MKPIKCILGNHDYVLLKEKKVVSVIKKEFPGASNSLVDYIYHRSEIPSSIIIKACINCGKVKNNEEEVIKEAGKLIKKIERIQNKNWALISDDPFIENMKKAIKNGKK